MKRALSTLLVLVLATGCYHATVDTGRTPSPQVIHEKWAHSFIIGLVPPKTVETAQKCPNGVAKVETQHSFLNGLVAILTWSIYTPIEIKVTCAAAGGGNDANLATVKAGADKTAAMHEAVKLAMEKNEPVLVKF